MYRFICFHVHRSKTMPIKWINSCRKRVEMFMIPCVRLTLRSHNFSDYKLIDFQNNKTIILLHCSSNTIFWIIHMVESTVIWMQENRLLRVIFRLKWLDFDLLTSVNITLTNGETDKSVENVNLYIYYNTRMAIEHT